MAIQSHSTRDHLFLGQWKANDYHYILPYNNFGLISKVSEDLATKITQNRHYCSMPLCQKSPCEYLQNPETGVHGLQFLSLIVWLYLNSNVLHWLLNTHAEKMRLWEPTTEIWMRLDPIKSKLSAAKMQANDSSFWRYKIYSNIREDSEGGESNDSGVVENGKFQRFRWLFFRIL